jgi:hypothetical protein
MRDEFYTPELANREKREALGEEDDAIGRAKCIIESVRSEKPESRLPADIRAKIIESLPELRVPAIK